VKDEKREMESEVLQIPEANTNSSKTRVVVKRKKEKNDLLHTVATLRNHLMQRRAGKRLGGKKGERWS